MENDHKLSFDSSIDLQNAAQAFAVALGNIVSTRLSDAAAAATALAVLVK